MVSVIHILHSIGEILEILLDAVIDDPSKNEWRTLMGIACDNAISRKALSFFYSLYGNSIPLLSHAIPIRVLHSFFDGS